MIAAVPNGMGTGKPYFVIRAVMPRAVGIALGKRYAASVAYAAGYNGVLLLGNAGIIRACEPIRPVTSIIYTR